MTKENREAAIKETLKWEGGYSNLASDPGGATNWGITLADARRYWKRNATAVDVQKMPQSIAIDIYRSKYWKTGFYDCDKLAAGVDLSVFDFGVNSGPNRAKLALDECVGGTSLETITKLNNWRMNFLRQLKTFPTFGTGWTRRVKGIQAKSMQMAQAPTPTVPVAATGILGAVGAAFYAGWEWIIHHPIETGSIAAGIGLVTYGIIRLHKWINS